MQKTVNEMQELGNVADVNLYAVISGSGEYSAIFELCHRITSVVEMMLDSSQEIDLAEPTTLVFLKSTLPTLIEAFLRRVTLREHVQDIAGMLVTVAKLLATPAAHDVPELCELRNLLLVGVLPHQMKFINTKQFNNNQNLATHLSRDGLFGDFGCPVVAYMGSKMLTFWPDEWQRALGGVRAVGHFVEWYHTGGIGDLVLAEESGKSDQLNTATADPADGDDTAEEASAPTWLVGRVVGYRRATGEYIIQLEPVNNSTTTATQRKQAEYCATPESFASSYGAPSTEGSPVPSSSPAPIAVFCKVDLTRVQHHWVDADYRNRIPLHPSPSSLTAAPGTTLAGDPLLDYSNADVGQFIRIWWSRYNKYYYGRISRYDPVNRMHAVAYEDGETRPYDMTTKDYELLTPPEGLFSGAEMSDTDAAKLVGDWHRALPEQGVLPVIPIEGPGAPHKFTWISRPNPATALNVSVYQLAVIDEYFRQGGADMMFQSLTDASQPAPISRLVLLHLQLVYHMRPIVGTDRFKDLVWEIKESVPYALFRYEDSQIKELSTKTLTDILGLLRDLILLVINGSQYVPNNNVREVLEEVRLTLGSSLLVCSQLQKRYLGLSMIRETLETLLPKLDGYMARRYTAIGVPRAAKSPTRAVSGTAVNTRITLNYMDKWLLENEVLESIFGESLHQDLASKSDAILVYMASRKVLTERHIDLIWNASLGVHEAVVRVIHQLLILIVPTLGPVLRNYLFSLMAALPSREYTEQVLQLIKTFTVQALLASKEDEKSSGGASGEGNGGGNSTSGNAAAAASSSTAGDSGLSKKSQATVTPQRQWMGFTVLWQFVQDPVQAANDPASGGGGGKSHEGVDEGLVDLAVQLLVELLQEEFKEERELVMQRCLDNIQAGRSVPVSMHILRRTLALYPPAPKSWFVLGRPSGPKIATVGQQIERLIKNSQLLEILFRDLDAYQKSISSAVGSGGGGEMAGIKKSLSGANIAKAISKIGRSQTPVPPASTQLQLQSAGTGGGKSSAQGRLSLLKGVSERLDFLRFIISNSSVRLNEAQTMLLWHAFAEGATSSETIEKLVVWLNALINKESKALSAVIDSLAQESDPTEPEQRSRLAFLSPQVLSLSTQGGYGIALSPGMAVVLAQLSSSAEDETGQPGASNAVVPTGGQELHATFEDGVLMKLFEEHLLRWAFQFEKVEVLSRLLVANLCFKLFLHANICNKSIKVEADGSWLRVGPLVGLPLLWRIAVDATDAQVARAAMTLLIELHHKTPAGKTNKAGESHKASLLRVCFKHLYLSMQSLQSDENSPHHSAPSTMEPSPSSAPAVLSAQASRRMGPSSSSEAASAGTDEWFSDGDQLMKPSVIAARIERLIVMLKLAIHRFYMAPEVLCTIKVLVGRDEAPAFTVVLKATDKVGQLRQKIAEHFKESVDAIQIYRAGKSSNLIGMSTPNQEFLERDELTLVQAKIGVTDCVTAQKKDAPAGEMGAPPGSMQPPRPSKETKDVLSPQDLTMNLLKPLNPLAWVCTEPAPQLRAGKTSSREQQQLRYDLFAVPPFPLVSVIETKLSEQLADTSAEVAEQSTGSASQQKAASGGVQRDSPMPVGPSTAVADLKAKVLEGLLPTVKANPYYVDQLLEVLDGYLSAELSAEATRQAGSSGADLSAAVWDILLSLPTHVQLTQQLRGIVNAADGSTAVLSKLLSPTCPYRLLYSLQIIETFLAQGASSSSSSSASGLSDWTVRFFHMGGAEYILHLLDAFLTKELAREARLTRRAPRASPAEDVASEGMPRKDVGAMLIALLCRVLYHLLMADPLFCAWQSTTGAAVSDPTVSVSESIPAGVILTSVDTACLTQKILACTLHAANLLKCELLTEAALKALCENSLMLLFGLLKAVDRGVEILKDSVDCRAWVTSLCIKCQSEAVRHAACRRLFELCASIFHKCADPGVAQEGKRNRLKLYDFVYQQIVASVDAASDDSAQQSGRGYTERVRHGEQVYTLLAAVETVRSSPYLVFPQLSSHKVMRSSSSLIKTQDSVASPGASPSAGRLPPGDPQQQQALIRLFITKLVHHTSTESFHSSQPDGTLLGILRVLLVLANSGDDKRTQLGAVEVDLESGEMVRLIPYLYGSCLFPSLPSQSPAGEQSPLAGAGTADPAVSTQEAACQTPESRRLAYALLYRLCESSAENFAQLVEAMGGDASASLATKAAGVDDAAGDAAVKRLPVWNYDPGALVKDPDAYVGLCNQGGTCYMNSFIQQLFHIPAFKAGLLRINASSGAKSSEDPNAQLLFQLQVMFGFMKFSQKRYYDTLPFCRAFLDYDGEPISLSEQKDINEFASMLFDKLEQNKEAAALLASTIQGKIVYRTRSIETAYRSEREENFYMLTAEVKEKATLEDSLDLFTADELFSGDNKIEDSDTGRKVDALRGCAIRSLPGTLIIHLKRFEFDLETLNRKKVNDHISFPMELNMFPYTEEGLQAKEDKLRAGGAAASAVAEARGDESPDSTEREESPSAPPPEAKKEKKADSYYRYTLKGVVAHVGAIDRGHYYSFIRDSEKGTGGWLEFNDRAVLPFSAEAIPVECFGGKDEYVNSAGVATTKVRENSAYLLIYERSTPDAVAQTEDYRPRVSSGTAEEVLGLTTRPSLRSGSIDETTPRQGVSKLVMKAVARENAEFQKDRFLFHPLHFAFVWQIQHLQSVTRLLAEFTGQPVHEREEDRNQRYIYDAAEPEEVQLTLESPENTLGTHKAALANLVLVSARFIVEVLVRAKAQACVHMFIERLEEIVMQDTTGNCAHALLETFGSEIPRSTDSDKAESALVPGGAYASSQSRTRMQSDLEQIEQSCHPWLAQMVVYCPHPQTVRSFLRLLLTCVKVVRAAHDAAKQAQRQQDQPTALVVKTQTVGEVDYAPCHAVVGLVERILMMTEKPQLDYLGVRDGFELKCLFLQQFAGLGTQEKILLVQLGAIPRLSCAFMAVYPSASKNPEAKLQYCCDLVAKLVSSAHSCSGPAASPTHAQDGTAGKAGTATASSSTNAVAPTSGARVTLKPIDMQAFLSRTYLEEAIFVSFRSAASALQKLYGWMPDEERVKLLDFVADKLIEQVQPTGTLLFYRAFFKVMSDLLQGAALPRIALHQPMVAKLVTKVQQLAHRQLPNDIEVVYETCRLLHILGTASAPAHAIVMQCKDQWKHMAAKLAGAKRIATTSSTTEQSASAAGNSGSARSGGTAGESSGSKNILSKVGSSASAFLMN